MATINVDSSNVESGDAGQAGLVADNNTSVASQNPFDRYENKVQEMSTMALISALLFGFSAGLWIEFDSAIFEANDEHNIIWAYLFTVTAMITLITSAMSTVVAISIIISFRRLMFKFGKETDGDSLRKFKRETHGIRHWVRRFIYISFTGMMATLGLYSVVKWDDSGLVVISVVLAVIGVLCLALIQIQIKRKYAAAVARK